LFELRFESRKKARWLGGTSVPALCTSQAA
jgi:hypothetical protein